MLDSFHDFYAISYKIIDEKKVTLQHNPSIEIPNYDHVLQYQHFEGEPA